MAGIKIFLVTLVCLLVAADLNARTILDEIMKKEDKKDDMNTRTLLDEIMKEEDKKDETTIYSSCKYILKKFCEAENGPYYIKAEVPCGYKKTYCQMTSLPGCEGGGWTLIMKTDGTKNTFKYHSSLWSNKTSYNPAGGKTGFDNVETKLPGYWDASFKEICIGMKHGDSLKFVKIPYEATSLYSVIADGHSRNTNIGRAAWKSLIANSSLQMKCPVEGFNVGNSRYARVRLGIVANNEASCVSFDSYIGLGGGFEYAPNARPTSGNDVFCCEPDNGLKNIPVMGYVLVR